MAQSILASQMTLAAFAIDFRPGSVGAMGRRMCAARDVCIVALAWTGSWAVLIGGIYSVF